MEQAMARNGNNYSYQRLKHDHDDEEDDDLREKVVGRLRNRSSFRLRGSRRRLKVKIPSLRRFMRKRVKVVKSAWSKVCRRLKESQSHFDQLFAGNYLFVQVTPTPLIKSFGKVNYTNDVHRLPASAYSVPNPSIYN